MRRPRKKSEYGIRLEEKQELKKIYGLREHTLRRYFEMAKKMTGNTGENLLSLIERRLDNIIYRSGFALSRKHARQLVSHGHFKLNARRVYIPSIILKINDLVEPRSLNQFEDVKTTRNNWLEVSSHKIKITSYPTREDIDTPINESLVLQFYSK